MHQNRGKPFVLGDSKNFYEGKISMGLLAVPRVLCVIVLLFFLSLGKVYAQNRFFDSQADFFGKGKEQTQPENKSCSTCDQPMEESKNPVTKIKTSFSTQKRSNNGVILFIDPQCPFNDKAIISLKSFKKNHQDWDVKVYSTASWNHFKEFALKNGGFFSEDLPLVFDIGNKYLNRFSILNVPVFVIQYEGRYYKIAGQPSLENIILQLSKK